MSNASLIGTEKPDVAIRVNKINIAINTNDERNNIEASEQVLTNENAMNLDA